MYDFIKTWDLWHYFNHASSVLAGKPVQFEYPYFSLGFMLLPRLFTGDFSLYSFLFDIQSFIAIALSFFLLWRVVGRQALWFLLPVALLFPMAIELMDIYVVMLTAIALFFHTQKKIVSSMLFLALGVATKLYPVMILPLVAVKSSRPLIGGLLLGISVFMATLNKSGVTFHLERGVQPESIYGSFLYLTGMRQTEYAFNSIQFAQSSMPIVLSLCILAALGIWFFFVRRYKNVYDIWFFAVGMFILFSKVFSPQYLLWLAPFVPFVNIRRKILYGLAVFLTTWYLGFYDLAVVKLVSPYAWIPVLRNLLLIASLL